MDYEYVKRKRTGKSLETRMSVNSFRKGTVVVLTVYLKDADLEVFDEGTACVKVAWDGRRIEVFHPQSDEDRANLLAIRNWKTEGPSKPCLHIPVKDGIEIEHTEKSKGPVASPPGEPIKRDGELIGYRYQIPEPIKIKSLKQPQPAKRPQAGEAKQPVAVQ